MASPATAPPRGRVQRKHYVNQLTRNALRNLRIIATHAPDMQVALVQRQASLSGAVFVGMMSTFGSAAPNTPGIADQPLRGSGDCDLIDTAISQHVIETLDRQGL